MRLFVAIRIDPPAPLEALREEVSSLAPLMRPVPRENLHLTLRFLGDQAGEAEEEIGRALERGLATTRWFNLELIGLAPLPARTGRLPRVLVTDVTPSEALRHVEREVRGVVAPWAPDDGKRDRPFRPHVTLARHRHRRRPSRSQQRRLDRMLEEWAGRPLGRVPVRTVELIESELGGGPPIYRTRRSVGLPV